MSSSTTSNQPSGLKSQDYHYLKCWMSMVKVGQQLLHYVLMWGFPDHVNLTIKQGLFQLPEYSNSKFKRDFNGEERAKIEKGISAEFDITLLNSLIQKLCLKLPPVLPPNVPKNKLHVSVLEVKNKRNKFAHQLMSLNETEMSNHINELIGLFETVIDDAKVEFNIDPHEASNIKNEIISQLQQIINTPLPAATMEEQLKELAEEQRRIVMEEGKKDLQINYEPFFEISVAPWPFAPLRKKMRDVFIKTKLKRTPFYCLQNRLSEVESAVDVDDLFRTKHLDSNETKFILLTGQTGVGKTTLMKYILDSWCDSSNATLFASDQFDLIFYLDCRETTVTSLQSFLLQSMPNTSSLFSEKELTDAVMNLKCLYMLDNLDETRSHSFAVINDIISAGTDSKILASATQDLGSQIIQKAQYRRPVNLILEGIPTASTNDYVKMLHNSLPSGMSNKPVESFASSVLSQDYLLQNWLTNPEILSHLFFSWCLAPNESSRCSTLTHILLQSFNLILKKLKDRLSSRSLIGVMELQTLQLKLQTFLLELGRIALSSASEDSKGLGFKNISQLLVKCNELGLPANVLLAEFLCFRESFEDKTLQSSLKATFPSLSFQEFCSAYHLHSLILDNENSQFNLRSHLGTDSLPETVGNKSRVTNILKFLVGLLAAGASDKLDSNTDQIMGVLTSFCQVKKSIHWFQILEEGQGHGVFTEAVLRVLGDHWSIEDHGISSLAVNLVERSPPKALTLVAIRDPVSLPHFQKMLDVCRSTKVDLSLYIYYDFWKFEGGCSEDYFLKICNDQSQCNLESFAGRLREDLFSVLPKSIKRLALQLRPADIQRLNETIPLLPNLFCLSINLDIPADFNFNMEPLRLKVCDTMILLLDLFNITEDNLEKHSSLIAKLCRRYTRLGVRKTHLGFKSTKKLVTLLHEENVNVRSMVVGSSQKVSSAEKVLLESTAKHSVGCKDFKWMEL